MLWHRSWLCLLSLARREYLPRTYIPIWQCDCSSCPWMIAFPIRTNLEIPSTKCDTITPVVLLENMQNSTINHCTFPVKVYRNCVNRGLKSQSGQGSSSRFSLPTALPTLRRCPPRPRARPARVQTLPLQCKGTRFRPARV